MKHESDRTQSPQNAAACAPMRLQASAWIDGELPEPAQLEAHLARCGACRAHVEELRATKTLLAPLRAGEAHADLWPRIRARTKPAAPVASRGSFPWSRMAAALIGCAGTAALLNAAARLSEAPDPAAGLALWPAALHAQHAAENQLQSTPERRLLAAIDPSSKNGK